MKKFDLERAKKGEPVCTREGRKVRIICYDFKHDDQPILALVDMGERESPYCFYEDGRCEKYKSNDLFMLSVPKINWRKCKEDDTVYVHSFLGSDETGDGTQAKPYKTLTKAGVITNKKRAICIGYFAEDMNGQGYYGANGSTIEADYYGAAVFDGQFKYTTWGVTMTDMIIINVTACAGGGLDGVGRAFNGNSVGDANLVNGVASAPNLIHNCCLHFGCIGGNTAVEHIVYSKIIHSSENYKIWIGNGWYDRTLAHSTVYDIDVTKRMKCRYGNPYIETTIFAKVAMIANDTQTFDRCLFTSDCQWYIFDDDSSESTYTEVVLTGNTSEERYQSLVDGVKKLGAELTVEFDECVFSAQTSDQIFNDPENLDFYLKKDCDAIRITESGDLVLGALPVANVNFKNTIEVLKNKGNE